MAKLQLNCPLKRPTKRQTLQRRTIVREVAVNVAANYANGFHHLQPTVPASSIHLSEANTHSSSKHTNVILLRRDNIKFPHLPILCHHPTPNVFFSFQKVCSHGQTCMGQKSTSLCSSLPIFPKQRMYLKPICVFKISLI